MFRMFSQWNARGVRDSVPVAVRECWLGAAAITLAAGVIASSAAAQPNIVFYMVDDLGWVDISAGGPNGGNASTFYQTPNIEQLAREGLSFTSAYACQNCEPTRAAFQTGQYAPRNGVHNVDGLNRAGNSKPLIGPPDPDGIRTSAYTVAEMLQDTGYVTAHFGKFHATFQDSQITSDHGYDFNLGGTHVGSPGSYHAVESSPGVWEYGSNKVGPELDQYAGPYTQQYVDENIKPYANGTPISAIDALVGTKKHLTDATTDAALEFMEAQRQAGKPFFANFTHYAVHSPLQPRADLATKYNAITSTDPRHTSKSYAGLIEGMDQSLGRLVDYLEDPNGDGDSNDSIAEETLVIFYSDNGGPGGHTDNSPLNGVKGMHTEGGIRVPMIAWQPGTIAPDTVNDSIVSVTDFYATFADVAGGTLPDPAVHPLESVSIADVLDGTATQSQREANYLHFPGYMDTRAVPTSLIIKEVGDEHYKLFYYYEDPDGDYTTYNGGYYELYNLTDDLGETTDLLAGTPSKDDWNVAVQMSEDLRAWLDEGGALYPTLRDPNTGTDTGVHVPAPTPLDQAFFAAGDLNRDGEINVDDWMNLTDGFGTVTTGLPDDQVWELGDMNVDGLVDRLDFGTFKDAFEGAHGDGSFTEMLQSIPEPSSLVLLVLGSLAATGRHRNVRPKR